MDTVYRRLARGAVCYSGTTDVAGFHSAAWVRLTDCAPHVMLLFSLVDYAYSSGRGFTFSCT